MVGFGTALAGYGEAVPQINQLQQMQQQKEQQAAMAKALQAYAAQRQGGGAPPAPGGMPAPMGAPPAGASAMPPGGGPSPNTQAPPVASPQGGFAGRMPDLNTMMGMLSKSGLSPDQQFEALQKYGAFASPFEKMQQQLEMTGNKLQTQRDMLDARLQEMRDIATMRNDTTRVGQGQRQDSQEATRDIGAVEKELADQRAYLTGLLNANPKIIDKPEYTQEKAKYDSLQQELQSMRKPGGAKPALGKPAAAPVKQAEGIPTPPEAKDFPDGTRIPDETGKMWIKKGAQLVPSE